MSAWSTNQGMLNLLSYDQHLSPTHPHQYTPVHTSTHQYTPVKNQFTPLHTSALQDNFCCISVKLLWTEVLLSAACFIALQNTPIHIIAQQDILNVVGFSAILYNMQFVNDPPTHYQQCSSGPVWELCYAVWDASNSQYSQGINPDKNFIQQSRNEK